MRRFKARRTQIDLSEPKDHIQALAATVTGLGQFNPNGQNNPELENNN